MPVVTVDPGEFSRFDLASAPPDGYVMLRPLPYGMRLTMRDKGIKQKMMIQQPQKGRAPQEERNIQLETASEWSTLFEWGYCIGDHNLTDSNDQQLDFGKVMSIKLLNPHVGAEIERLLAELNNEEDEESLQDFLLRSPTSSEEDTNESGMGLHATREPSPEPQ